MKKQPDITKEQFLAAKLEDISQVYLGKRHCCRCGCGGEYTFTTHSTRKEKYYEVNNELVAKRLKRAKELVMKAQTIGNGNINVDADVVFGTTYVDVKTDVRGNRCFTFYFDETKKNP